MRASARLIAGLLIAGALAAAIGLGYRASYEAWREAEDVSGFLLILAQIGPGFALWIMLWALAVGGIMVWVVARLCGTVTYHACLIGGAIAAVAEPIASSLLLRAMLADIPLSDGVVYRPGHIAAQDLLFWIVTLVPVGLLCGWVFWKIALEARPTLRHFV